MGVYKKGSKWRVVIHLGKGKRRDWLVEGSRNDALAFEARQRTELEVGTLSEHRTSPSLKSFCASHYAEYASVRLKKRTWTNRRYTLKVLIEDLGGERLTDLRRPLIEKYQLRRVAAYLKSTSINDEIKVLRAVMRYAIAIGVPCAKPDFPDLPVRHVRRVTAWNREQVGALLRSIRETSPHIYGIVLFMLDTGCRKGEALALEWTCVDLKRRLIRIEPNEEWQPKDNEPREIPISDHLLLHFNRMQKHRRWVFPADTGDRYAFWPQLAFDRARKAAGLKGGPHATRHTYASHFLTKVPDLWLLAKILGHSTTGVTSLYAHLLPDHLSRALNAVDFGLEFDS